MKLEVKNLFFSYNSKNPVLENINLDLTENSISMRNLFYSPDFEKTQKKYNVREIPVNGSYNYDRRRDNWLRKVGEL